LSHKIEPLGGWYIDTAIMAVAGKSGSQTMRDGRRRLKEDADELKALGLILDGDRIRKNGPTTPKAWHSGPIAWHSGPIAWHSGPKRGTAARSKQDIQDIQILRGAARAWCAVWPCHRPRLRRPPPGVMGQRGEGVEAGFPA
jgi:hypothetical protein